MTDEEKEDPGGRKRIVRVAASCWGFLRNRGPYARRLASHARLALRDFRSFVGYSVLPGCLGYIIGALVSGSSFLAWSTWRALIQNGSLYMLSVGLAGNLALRVMSLNHKSARDNLHVWTMLLLAGSAAGFGVTAGSDSSKLSGDFTDASLFVFVTTLIMAAFISIAAVRDDGRADVEVQQLQATVAELRSTVELLRGEGVTIDTDRSRRSMNLDPQGEPPELVEEHEEEEEEDDEL